MVHRGRVITRKLVRHRTLPQDGSHTLFFKVDIGRLGRFLMPHQVPDFEGEEGWFEVQQIGGEIVVLRQVAAPLARQP